MNKECTHDYAVMNDGSIKLGYKENNNNLDYDTTELIINTNPMNIEGHILYNCLVSWYDSSWKKKNEFFNIIVEFDKASLFGDEKYYNYFMSKLLSKERVMKYLKQGLSPNADIECGIYVGSVDYNDEGVLERHFYKEIGTICHNEDYMVALRDAVGGRTK